MPQPPPSPSFELQQLVVDVVAAGEWIVSVRGGRPLHVYQLSAADWLVSEVGRVSEGRGADLRLALQSLSARTPSVGWWAAVPEALVEERRSARRAA